MSKVILVSNTGQQATTNYNVAKIFIWNNRYVTETIVNSEYDPWVLPAGTVLGRITGSVTALNPKGTVVPCENHQTDGSVEPIGILAADVTIQDGTQMDVPVCIAGDVSEDQIALVAPLTLDSVVVVGTVGKTMRDRIRANTGINIVKNSENTYLDNQ